MMGKQHIIFGLALGTAIYPVLPETLTKLGTSSSVKEALLFTGIYGAGVVLGSLLPDIDLEDSTISQIFPFTILSFFIRKLGHRTITHDVLWTIPLGIFLILKYPWFIGLILGYWGHLFLDGFTRSGIMWGYIFNKNKLKPYWNNELQKLVYKDRDRMTFKDGIIHLIPRGIFIKEKKPDFFGDYHIKWQLKFRPLSDSKYAKVLTLILSIGIFFLVGNLYYKAVPNGIYYDVFLSREKQAKWLVNNGDEETIQTLIDQGWIDENLNYIK